MKLSLFAVMIFLSIGLSAEEFSLENPSDVIKKTEAYIQSGEIYRDKYNKDIFKDRIPKNLTVDKLYFQKLKYSLLHDWVDVEYIIKDSFTDKSSKSSNTPSYDYRFISIRLHNDGKCLIAGIAEVSSSPANTSQDIKKFSLKDLNKIKDTANKFIDRTTIKSNGNIQESGGFALTEQGNIEKFERILTERIPKNIKSKDLILISIENQFSGQCANVDYCIKPTLYRESLMDIGFYKLSLNINNEGLCGLVGIYKSSVRNESYPLKEHYNKLTETETKDIYEIVFRTMFEKAANWEKEIKFRFIDLGFDKQLSADFFKRFNNEKISVCNPFVKDEKYRPKTFHARYMPEGKDALFYSITGLCQLDETHIFVDCRVTCHLLAARGYTYLLEKTDGKWKVISIKHTWLS